MIDRLWFIIPELILFTGAMIVAVMGLSHRASLRRMLPCAACGSLLLAAALTPWIYSQSALETSSAGVLLPDLGRVLKIIVCSVGILLAMCATGLVDRRLESDIESRRIEFDPLRTSRGEFWAFFLLSLTGVMLVSGAQDLIWLFLALELTSLPTYLMVAISRPDRRAQESAMKYFFLGAMASAVFLFGFVLLYGGTGTLVLPEIRDVIAQQVASGGGINLFVITGMILSILGLCYKIAAVPMHMYAADVYEGAASPVTAFLGFAPKAAGVVSLIILLSTMGWDGGLPRPIAATLWMVAILTMTLGNVGALLQGSVKRMLAYSSIAHSGYMVIGLLAGPGLGLSAVMLYLLIYGLMNTGAFSVIAGLVREGGEVERLEDLAGLRRRHPAMAWSLAICSGSLLGFPPLLGFIGKLYLFIAGVEAGYLVLVVLAGINSAISAWYYLRLVGLPILSDPSPQGDSIDVSPTPWPRRAAILATIALLVLPIFARHLLKLVEDAGPRAAMEAEQDTRESEEPLLTVVEKRYDLPRQGGG